jgi:hypothetical protein
MNGRDGRGYLHGIGDEVRVGSESGGRVLDRAMRRNIGSEKEFPIYLVSFDEHQADWFVEEDVRSAIVEDDFKGQPSGALIGILAVLAAALVAGTVIWLLLT